LMPDVNILVYAHREDEVINASYRRWFEELVNRAEPFALSVLVAVGFVRVVTNSKIFDNPTPAAVAWGAVEAIVAHPQCRVVYPKDAHLQLAAQLCRSTNARGKVVADAQHAAIALEHGCEWVSRDGDFARFSAFGLRWTHLVLK